MLRSAQTIVFIFLIAVLAGCASEARKRSEFFAPKESSEMAQRRKKEPRPPPYTRAAAEDAICEAVVRRFAEDAAGRLQTPVALVFVAFTPSRLDPDPGFLKRFTSKKLQARPFSSATRSEPNQLIEKGTGERGVSLRIDRVDWLDYYNVEVPCSWSPDASSDVAFFYRLGFRKGKWILL
ncbi:MAG: hypothetical protein HY735_24860 [Verrucomicrobia bacterium]|nr:hypothetical protein [Verrucomicrobiota bacterium]